jgi:hypothetical protein
MLQEAHVVGLAVEGVAVVGACVGVEVGPGDGVRLHATGQSRTGGLVLPEKPYRHRQYGEASAGGACTETRSELCMLHEAQLVGMAVEVLRLWNGLARLSVLQ